MKCRNFGNKMVIVADEAHHDQRRRSTLTVDELLDLNQPNFEAITRKTIEQVPVYRYLYGDLPQELSCAEILERNRSRWQEFFDA
jgi:hypothetical protein